MLEELILNRFVAQNEAHDRLLVFHLGDRGFYAEFTAVARAMSYAWQHKLQLVLKSDEFSYRYRDGWTDYFQPFCPEYHPEMEPRVVLHARFGIYPEPKDIKLKDRPNFMKIARYLVQDFRIDFLTLHQNQNILKVFSAALFRLNHETEVRTNASIDNLNLPQEYLAVHIRRGDKVGDEDIFYPCKTYVDHLPDLDRITAMFVLSDDYAAVVELQEYLEEIGQKKDIFTLCTEQHSGYDVWKMRRKELFFQAKSVQSERAQDVSYENYVYKETIRLLTETIVASRAVNFVSSRRSNVGTMIRFLHTRPENCATIG